MLNTYSGWLQTLCLKCIYVVWISKFIQYNDPNNEVFYQKCKPITDKKCWNTEYHHRYAWENAC